MSLHDTTDGTSGLEQDAIQAAWRGLGQENAMVAVLDPYPRWQRKQPDLPLPTPGGCELLAALWTGSDDDRVAWRALLQVLDQVLQSPVVDLPTLVESIPEEVDVITLRASDLLGRWPMAPRALLAEGSRR